MERSPRRMIVDLLPRYAHARRAGWTPTPGASGPITLPGYILLRRIAMVLDDAPMSYADLHAMLRDPYSTVDSVLTPLPHLVTSGLLDQQGDTYALSSAGHDLLTHNEPAANDYAAARLRVPPDDLLRLASILHDVAERQRRAPEPTPKAHQDQVPRLRRFDQRQTSPVQLEYALYALQRARDDAHLAAWRAAGFRGPPFVLLSHLWADGIATVAELEERTHHRMRPGDVAVLLDDLARDGYLTRRGPSVAMTSHGREVRDAVEQETDRVFFASWPPVDAAWVCDRREAVAVGLAS